jgi:thiol-disulfide isomerase/thioredoxin
VTKLKILIGALAAIAVAAGLFLANRYLVKPAASLQLQAKGFGSGDHPMAPDFSLSDLSGQKVSLADYRGKVVLLDFWATWCGPCRIEIPGFVELQNRYRDQGFVVIGVSMDDGPDPVKEFYKQFKMNYPVVLGDDKLGEEYGGILGLPTSMLIGRDGRIYAKHVGAASPAVFEDEIKALLAAQGTAEVQGFKQVGRTSDADKIEIASKAEVESEVPGVDLSGLTPVQRTAYKKELAGMKCDCGCNLTVLKCRQVDRMCGVSRKIAKDEFAKFSSKAGQPTSSQKAG